MVTFFFKVSDIRQPSKGHVRPLCVPKSSTAFLFIEYFFVKCKNKTFFVCKCHRRLSWTVQQRVCLFFDIMILKNAKKNQTNKKPSKKESPNVIEEFCVRMSSYRALLHWHRSIFRSRILQNIHKNHQNSKNVCIICFILLIPHTYI